MLKRRFCRRVRQAVEPQSIMANLDGWYKVLDGCFEPGGWDRAGTYIETSPMMVQSSFSSCFGDFSASSPLRASRQECTNIRDQLGQ